MRDQTLIKRFEYNEGTRSDLVFSDTAEIYLESRLFQGPGVKLRPDSSTGEYPTTGEQWVRHRVTEPLALLGWQGFDYEADLPDGTSLGFRLSDGVDDWYWDGAAWSTPGAGDWSTVQEINDNVSTFPSMLATADRKKLQVVTRLVSTDSSLTPRLRTIKLLYRARINFSEDVILRSLIPALKSGVTTFKDFAKKLPATTSVLEVGPGQAHSVAPYEVADVVGVWNHTDDPDHLVDLFDSFDEGAQEIALTTSVDQGKKIWISFLAPTDVSIAKHPDYYEVATIPALVVERLRPVGKLHGTPGRRDAVINRDQKTATVVAEVDETSYDVDILAVVDRVADRFRLGDRLRQWVDENPLLHLVGLDDLLPIRLMRDPDWTGQPEGSGRLMGSLTVRLDRVAYPPPSRERNVITNWQPELTGP